MGDVFVVHETVLYEAFNEIGDVDSQKASKDFLNKCGEENYNGKNIAYLPGEVFDRIFNFCIEKKCDELISFCDLLSIKYSNIDQTDIDTTYTPYVRLACNLCLNNKISIICAPSSEESFKGKLTTDKYIFSVWNPLFALNSYF